jgi:class 3 adenylate cyclase/predicted ATPase
MSASPSANVSCPRCGFESPYGYAFCGRCGAPLTNQNSTFIPAQIEKQPDKADDNAQRRQLTVMFCDLVGSTALSEQLDPEDLREVMFAYRDACSRVINRFEGYIAQFLGDGLMVYFGYPVAHEDDAHRAVRAGLGIVEAIKNLNPSLEKGRGVKLAVRLGVHTGLVVAGDMATGEQLQPKAVVGETPNVAARVQSLAEPDSIVISQATHRLVQGYFDLRNQGAHSLKGISKPVEIYQVLSESSARTRLDVAAVTGFTPLVGREKEWNAMVSLWEQAKNGSGQVALLSGEAGIGKSRLVHKLKEQVAQEPGAWLTPCQCLSHYQNSALYPIIDLLERLVLGFEREDTHQQKLSKLEGWLVQYGFSLPETTPLFASLLSIPLGGTYPPLNLTSEQIKQKTFQALLTVLLKRAALQPLLFVMEDLHWADSSTLDLLSQLIDQAPAARICLLLTFRPEFRPPWAMNSYMTHFTLSRLPHAQTEAMIGRLTQGKALPPEVVKDLVMKTDGVPLFVEELTKMVLESGLLKEQEGRFELSGPLPPLSIPTTLQDSLLARLDKLATVKEVLQLAATIGQEFTYIVLRAVSQLDDLALQYELGRLVDAELIYPSGFPPEARYVFKHALIQDAAYQQQLKSRRQISHQRIAQVLEKEFSDTAETQPELVAHHYTEAGLAEQAIPYWLKAGRRAMERSANVEVINHLTKGIELLKKFEETPERIRQELEFLTALGPAQQALKGFGAPEVRQTYSRARELGQRISEARGAMDHIAKDAGARELDQIFPAMWGVWYFYAIYPELKKGKELAEQLVTLARDLQDPALLLVAYRTLGSTLFAYGEPAQALEVLKQGIELYDPQKHRSLAFVYGQDIGVVCRGWVAWSLLLLGYPDQAAKMALEAIDMARELSHPLTLAYALAVGSYTYLLLQKIEQARKLAQESFELSGEQGFVFFYTHSAMILGVLADADQIEQGVTQTRGGMAGLEAAGAALLLPVHQIGLAEIFASLGKIEDGLAIVAEGLALIERGDEHIWEADLYRAKGDVLLLKGENESEVEDCFQHAISIAKQQSTKLYELRAAMSLSRLWQKQGKAEEAHNLLSEIYSWFTEGFDTADLKEAKALLESLA